MGGEGGSRVLVAGRTRGFPFGGGGSMLSARDVGRCSAECEDRGQQDWDHNGSITTGPL